MRLLSKLLYLLPAIMIATAQAQTPTILANLNSNNGNPNWIIQASDGFFYISTDLGPVLKMSSSGELFNFYNFAPPDDPGVFINADPAPATSILQGADGNFYGTTGGCSSNGCVYELTPAAVMTTVYNFSSSDANGSNPLIQGTDGNFYGTTSQGGSTANTCPTIPPAPGCSDSNGDGTIFKLTPSGVFTILHNFMGPDGSQPYGALVQGTDGNLYGTAEFGGANNCQVGYQGGCGTVFKITPAGDFTLLYSFNGTDAGNPQAGLIQGADGNFYGTTSAGGTGNCTAYGSTGCGSIFKITPSGVLTTLYSFNIADGAVPEAPLVQAADGTFYGSTLFGGPGDCPADPGTYPNGCGTIFSITPAGTFTTLYNLPVSNTPNRVYLVLGQDGNLYGTSARDGEFKRGTVFKFSIASANAPAIAANNGVLNGASFQPGISPGSWITIAGTNFATQPGSWTVTNGVLPTSVNGVSVSVGGQPAYVEYVSSTQINALAPSVPAGTVAVTVTNSNGTSQSVNAQLSAETPAFFQWGTYAVATRQDFSYAVKNGAISGLTTTPAKPGDVIILWGTGFGPTSPAVPAGMETPSTATYNTATTVSVTVGGKTATVYGAALASGYAGLYQVAIQIPAGLSKGDYPVIASVNGALSPSATMITIQE